MHHFIIPKHITTRSLTLALDACHQANCFGGLDIKLCNDFGFRVAAFKRFENGRGEFAVCSGVDDQFIFSARYAPNCLSECEQRQDK